MRYPNEEYAQRLVEDVPPPSHEKPALQSKKFVAFLVCEVGFFVLMAFMLAQGSVNDLGGNMAFMVLAVTSGFLATAYIGGQAAVDAYVRAAAMTMGKELPPKEKSE